MTSTRPKKIGTAEASRHFGVDFVSNDENNINFTYTYKQPGGHN